MSEEATLDEFTDVDSEENDGKHQITGFGTFPSEWDKKAITTCAKIRDSERIPLNSQEREEKKPGNIPYYGANGVLDYIDEYIFDSELILLAEDGGHFEEYQERPIAYRISGKSWVNNHAHILEARDGVVTDYLFYSLEHRNLVPYVSGSTRSKLTQSMLRKVKIPSPSLPEQRKIATVLYTVDRAIEKTVEMREQVERVRAGIAQDLFRNGISQGNTKDTWLGEIPEDWDVVPFSEIVNSNRNGLYKSKDAYGEGYPIAKMGNALEKRTLDMSSADRLELTNEENEKYGLKKGDLIFARRAQEVSAAGDCCYVPELDELTVFESSLIRVRLSERANPRFYTQYFDSPVGSRSIDRIVTETSISGVATSDLLDLKVAVPSPTEQDEIASIMWQFDEQEKALKKEIQQYKRLKRGIQQDLLSGNIRMTDTNIEVPDKITQHG
ncbi:hypothetical protein DQW50_08670 [Halorubrum sp. 48-1-W]|uniref:restriction endonuclease subunit S n=1 Tax=Halorubrum sp. 48-1-W TaxID=2249761 RepID=UPI000DCBE813|nr:restriction endonuclease subunit S [Halorubrum sp. 48-1-W]RAW45607.1 hypothetical protein DQW50_08670 [Halorubrum sp. 48-1-W]